MTRFIVTYLGSPSYGIGQLQNALAGMSGSSYQIFETKSQMEDFLSENSEIRQVRVYEIAKEYKLKLGNVELKEIE